MFSGLDSGMTGETLLHLQLQSFTTKLGGNTFRRGESTGDTHIYLIRGAQRCITVMCVSHKGLAQHRQTAKVGVARRAGDADVLSC